MTYLVIHTWRLVAIRNPVFHKFDNIQYAITIFFNSATFINLTDDNDPRFAGNGYNQLPNNTDLNV